MLHCPDCGWILLQLEYGGCGGNGSLTGCEMCNKVFLQTSGGIRDTGEMSYTREHYTLEEYLKSHPEKKRKRE